MKTLTKLALCMAAFSALALSTQAYTLVQINGLASGNVNSPQDVIDDFGIDPCDLLYQTDNNGGLNNDDFTDDDGANPITIQYDGDVPRPGLTYIALKAANSYALFSITGWTGEDIVIQNTLILNRQGVPQNISHVIIFGKDDGSGGGGGGNVPDAGATGLLLGLGTLGVAAASRKLKK